MQAEQPVVDAIWREKYRYGDEKTIEDSFRRIALGITKKDTKPGFYDEVLAGLVARQLVPAGRIQAGAGTNKRVTLINCFVSPDIQDSLDTESSLSGMGIMDALKVAAKTQQMGGGIGMDYSTVRPEGAIVKRTQSVSSGVLPFMDMWHSMCGTVMSSGSRRGAMMGTLAIWHPDILKFVVAKQREGRLTNFNVSVLVTDAFMKALEDDAEWLLHFPVPPAEEFAQMTARYGSERLVVGSSYRPATNGESFTDSKGVEQFIYKRMRARDLWDLIIENTYIHAEPGIIFVDRVNYWNNLQYCEYIHCTNPCGEQPLPPNGDCNLGHQNLAVMVKHPFTEHAEFDFDLLRKSTATMQRFLDDVLDETQFPTEEQAIEAANKRRTGQGYTGLANALQMLRMRYGSPNAIAFTALVTQELCFAAYRESIELAKERGSFPAFDAAKYCETPFIKTLPQDIQDGIRKHGIRNSVLMTIAPTGTTSVTSGNVSSGIEPVIVLRGKRKVLQDDNSFKTFDVMDYGLLEYYKFKGVKDPQAKLELPDYVDCTIDTLTVDEHLLMQAAAQKWVDASISKTVNCPTSMTFEEFKDVYAKAYKYNLKGCTTYRPDPRSTRGVVISKDEPKPASDKVPMQEVLEGRRYRVKWPTLDTAFYVIIDDYIDDKGQRRPFEIFIMSKSAQHDEWMKAVTLLITAIFRRGGDVTFITNELKQVYSATGGAFFGKKYVNSLIAAIAEKLEEHFRWLGLLPPEEGSPAPAPVAAIAPVVFAAERCPSCSAPALVHAEGCKKCTSCGFTSCG